MSVRLSFLLLAVIGVVKVHPVVGCDARPVQALEKLRDLMVTEVPQQALSQVWPCRLQSLGAIEVSGRGKGLMIGCKTCRTRNRCACEDLFLLGPGRNSALVLYEVRSRQ